MTLPTDYLVDRWRLSRRVSFWRWATAAALLLAVVVGAWRFAGSATPGHLTPHIARVSISGVIVGDDATLKLIRDVAESRASGVILKISSPGGTTTGAEVLYEELRRLAAKKPSRRAIRWSARSASCSNSRTSRNCSTRWACRSRR